MALQKYRTETYALLRDRYGLLTPQSEIDMWINSGRREAAERSGCLRFNLSGQSAWGTGGQPGSIIPGAMQPGAMPNSSPNAVQSTPTNQFQTITGVELYPFDFARPFLQAQFAGVDAIIDVIDLAVSWGSNRPSMNWMPWEDLQAYARSYNVGVFSYPFLWSTNGDGENAQVWLFPTPQVPCEMEWDVTCTPLELTTDADYEALPRTFQAAIKYYAASLALQGSQRYGLADQMMNEFMRRLGVSRAASDRGKVPDMYWQSQLP